MKVTLAKYGGFCIGVKRALNIVESAPNPCILGYLVNNDRVMERLKSKGVNIVSSVGEAGEKPIVISASSTLKSNYEALASKPYYDATCRVVFRCVEIAKRSQIEGKTLVIIGEKDHLEVKNVASFADKVEYILTEKEAEEFTFSKSKGYIVITQTTFPKARAEYIYSLLKTKANENVEFVFTLCDSVRKRVEEAVENAKTHEKVLVVGDSKSANCRFLYNAALEVNPQTYFIESADFISEGFTAESVFVTGGASVDPEDIKEVVRKLVTRE
ncbi:MAG: hypothetical protein IJS93_00005 [Clostridia bacterium]|nr:hypothetical protein [Clostridia bacterium]